MSNQLIPVSIHLDLSIPEEKKLFDQYCKLKNIDKQLKDGLSHIFYKTEVMNKLIVPAFHAYQPGKKFSMEELANVCQISKKQAASLMAVLGRPEKNYGIKVFEPFEHNEKKYYFRPKVYSILNDLINK